ncbi:MAG: thioredoxin [Bacteroidales bacterium]|jgi:thioredoxin|nr:thioredoxin [Bacteroidales bacterium]MBO7323535.1 thioredoxin [Bacteroidales bacterium]
MRKILIIAAVAFTALFASVADMNASDKGKVKHLTKAEFVKLVYDIDKNTESLDYLGNKPAVVDFYADWCRPCKQLAPVLEELAAEYQDEIVVYKVNTDNDPELAQAFGITSIPTLIFIPLNGSPEMAQGALPKDTLKEVIEKVLLDK